MFDNFKFLKSVYEQGWTNNETVAKFVITPENPYGSLNKEQFMEITGKDYDQFIAEQKAK